MNANSSGKRNSLTGNFDDTTCRGSARLVRLRALRKSWPGLWPVLLGLLAGCAANDAGSGVRPAALRPLPVEWQRPLARPCISLGREGEFDSHHLHAPAVVLSETQGRIHYRMFYCGSGPEPNRLFKIGLADSRDGLAWQKRPGGPVLAFGDGKTSLVTPSILRDPAAGEAGERGRLRMWVAAVDFNTDEKKHLLYHSTSDDDGITWSPLQGPLMPDVYAPSVLKIDGAYRMWYVDAAAKPWCIRTADSADGLSWRVHPEPCLVIDQPWEKDALFYPHVRCDGSRYLMWYGSYLSSNHDSTALGLAVSSDGLYWRKYHANPVITPDPKRPFESNHCTSQSVLPYYGDLGGAVQDRGRLRDASTGWTGYQIWYATGTQDAGKYKYFSIATAISFSMGLAVPPVSATTAVPVTTQPAFSMSMQQPNDPRIEPLSFLTRYGQERTPQYHFAARNERELRDWNAEAFRAELVKTIGLPQVGRPPLRVTPGPVDPCDGYTRHAFTIETAPGLYVPAFLLVPEGAKRRRPAILCSHGHGYGMNDLVGLKEDGTPREPGADPGYERDFALQAVRAGFVTLAFDQMGFGRRRDVDFNKQQNLWNACEQPSKNAAHFGMSMTGIRVYDAMRMIDFLETRPEVDPRRIGMTGISGGGLVTQFTAAIDKRVRAACVSGFCNRYEGCILSLHHCIDNYVPGLGLIADNDDVACLIAPRPLLIEGGIQDPIFPIAATRAAVAKLERCYRLNGAADRLEANLFNGQHVFDAAKTWDFFRKHLSMAE